MERNGRQYFLLQDVASAADLLTLYDGDQAAFESEHRGAAQRCRAMRTSAEQLTRLASLSKDVHRTLRDRPRLEGAGDAIIERFSVLSEATRAVANGMRGAINAPTRNAAGKYALGAAGARVAVGRADPRHARARRVVPACSSAGRCARSTARFASSAKATSAGRSRSAARATSRRSAGSSSGCAIGSRNRRTRRTSSCATCRTSSRRRSRTFAKAPSCLLDGSVGTLDIQQQEVTGILRDNGVKLQRLIENLLTFSAWQTHTAALELAGVRVEADGVQRARASIASCSRTRRSNCSSRSAPINVLADEGKLKLVLENLLSNAIKFTPSGGTIHVGAGMEGHELVIDVSDDGPGVDPDDGDRIFEAFYQGRRPQGGPVGGTGHRSVGGGGMRAGARRLRAALRGEVSGAHFQVRLPLRRATDKRVRAVANG